MNVQLLIDAIVRQTTVLIAQLATSGGARAPLAHVANQVFVDLAAELERQGLGRKVTADMFGISLRSYQRKVQRLRESSTDRGRSIWEAMLDYLGQAGVVTRQSVQERFHRDPEGVVAAVLRDMVEAGLVFCTGSGLQAVYRIASDEELLVARQATTKDGLAEFVWTHVFRHGPITSAKLAELVKVDVSQLDQVLAELVQAGRVVEQRRDDHPTEYASERLVVSADTQTGWEASVYDHFQAMVATISTKVSPEPDQAVYAPYMGGSTYTLNVNPEHPLREEALQTLSEFRQRCSELRRRIIEYNAHSTSNAPDERVVVYAGETVIREDKDPEGGEHA